MTKFISLLFFILLGSQVFAEEIKSAKMDVSSPQSNVSATDETDDAMLMQQMKTRRTMLNWHQYTALGTAGLMLATALTAPDDDGFEGDDDDDEHEGGGGDGGLNTHKTLGILAGVGYLTSAALALTAPKMDVPAQKNIFIHKTLAWIHFPAFMLTIASGLDAADGDEGSLAEMHSTFVAVTAVSFATAAFFSTDWSMMVLPTDKKEVACVLTKSF